MTKQTLLEKADTLLETVNENSDPLSSLSLLDVCLKWYNDEMKKATLKKDIDNVLYCKNKILEVTEKRDKIIIPPAEDIDKHY